MKYEAKYAGKWVAEKEEKIIAADSSLTGLRSKISQKDKSKVIFTLVPKGFIAG